MLRKLYSRTRPNIEKNTGAIDEAPRPQPDPKSIECQLDYVRFSSKKEFDQFSDDHRGAMDSRWLMGRHLNQLCRNSGRLLGWCTVCQTPSAFSYRTDENDEVNLREDLACEKCGLIARVRCGMTWLNELIHDKNRADLYLTEQTSLVYTWLKNQPYANVIGSEFFPDEKREALENHLSIRGFSKDLLRYEDVTQLTMSDRSIDAIVSFEVLEHVSEFEAALAEFARVLRPGGFLLMTVPFVESNQETIKRAGLNASGEIEHYMEPEYHGDPVDSSGVLAFYHFGWDILDHLSAAGFTESAWHMSWNFSVGFPGNLWTLIARR